MYAYVSFTKIIIIIIYYIIYIIIILFYLYLYIILRPFSLYLFCFKLTTIWLCQALCFVCSSNISCQLWSMTLQSSLKNLLHFQICHSLWPKWFVINFCKFCIVLRNHIAKNKTNIFLVECCWHAILVALHVLEIPVRNQIQIRCVFDQGYGGGGGKK